MKFENHIVPFQLANNEVRGMIVRFDSTVYQIIKRHNYPSNLESLLADTLTITACLGSRMKHDGIFTIQAKGTGPVHTLFADITNNGFLRGYVGYDKDLINKDFNLLPLMGSGHISFTLDQGKFSKRYQGIVALDAESISKATELYFTNSEQLETKFSTFNYYDIRENDRINLYPAGLMMLQKMPMKDNFSDDAYKESWDLSIKFLSTLKKEEFLSTKLSSEDILYRLFHEIGVTIYDQIIIKDQCRCSQEKVDFAINNLDKIELDQIADANGNIKVVCEFCKIERSFSRPN
jgi:molecular chaperone Hsp33